MISISSRRPPAPAVPYRRVGRYRMTNYRIEHRTTYTYDSDVHRELRTVSSPPA